MFYFSWYCNHRDLHSFPTRRSSDLIRDTEEEGSSASMMLSKMNFGPLPMVNNLSRLAARFYDDKAQIEMLRSEEHTSELQSQFHLVCRLLLEKKKKAQAQKPHRIVA